MQNWEELTSTEQAILFHEYEKLMQDMLNVDAEWMDKLVKPSKDDVGAPIYISQEGDYFIPVQTFGLHVYLHTRGIAVPG